METIVLTDKSTEPNDEIIFSYIGEKKLLWNQVISHLTTKEMVGEWRYYNDGKSWLFRGLKKEKVIFWVGVIQGNFRVSFYLSGKAEPLVESSNLPQEIKTGFEETKGQKFRAITILMDNETDVENVKKLIDIKLKVK